MLISGRSASVLLPRKLRTLGRSESRAAGFSLQPDPAARRGSLLSFGGENLPLRRKSPARRGQRVSGRRSLHARHVPGRTIALATNRASGSAAIAAAADDRNRVSGASPPRVRQLVNARARRVVAGVAGVEGLGVRRLRPRRLSDPPGKSGSPGMPVPTRTQNSTPATARDPLFARSGLVVEACRRPAPPPCVRGRAQALRRSEESLHEVVEGPDPGRRVRVERGIYRQANGK